MMERNKKRGELNPKLTSQIKGVDRISKMSLYQSWEVKGVKSEGTEKEEREKGRREEEKRKKTDWLDRTGHGRAGLTFFSPTVISEELQFRRSRDGS